MRVFPNLPHSRWSLRRRLFGSMLLLTAVLMAALASGLFLSGRFSSTRKETAQTLELVLQASANDCASGLR